MRHARVSTPTSVSERGRGLPRLALEQVEPRAGVATLERASSAPQHARERLAAELVRRARREPREQGAVREHEQVPRERRARRSRAGPRAAARRAASPTNGASSSAPSRPPTVASGAGIVEAPKERDEEPEAHAFRHRRDGAERDERPHRAGVPPHERVQRAHDGPLARHEPLVRSPTATASRAPRSALPRRRAARDREERVATRSRERRGIVLGDERLPRGAAHPRAQRGIAHERRHPIGERGDVARAARGTPSARPRRARAAPTRSTATTGTAHAIASRIVRPSPSGPRLACTSTSRFAITAAASSRSPRKRTRGAMPERVRARAERGAEPAAGAGRVRLAADDEEPRVRRDVGDARGGVEEHVLRLQRRERADDAQPDLARRLRQVRRQREPGTTRGRRPRCSGRRGSARDPAPAAGSRSPRSARSRARRRSAGRARAARRARAAGPRALRARTRRADSRAPGAGARPDRAPSRRSSAARRAPGARAPPAFACGGCRRSTPRGRAARRSSVPHVRRARAARRATARRGSRRRRRAPRRRAGRPRARAP